MMRSRIMHVRHEIFDMAQSWSIDAIAIIRCLMLSPNSVKSLIIV